ncbi:MAG TPA: TRAP transporter substrate-binding protein [Syntrophorhabdaceae bacterium]|nr:TRAP transporter substrate-binding protein [Syntrophorhabdaceae bacterium]
MKKTCVFCCAAIFVCFALLTGMSYGADKVTKLEFASYLPATEDVSLTLQEWCKEVEKRTNGRVTVTYHPGGTLVSMPQTYEAVTNGIADLGFSAFGYTPGRFPMMELLDLPTGLKTSLLAVKLTQDYVNRFKPKELQDVKVLWFTATTPALLHTKKPIKKLEDLKGMKIRTVGGPMVELVKDLGAVPVVIPTVDTYDAAAKGVIDGTYSAWPGLTVFKWGEVLPFTVENTLTAPASIQFVVMNKEKWNSLPPDIQQIMDKLSEEYAVKTAQTWERMSAESVNALKAMKHTISPLSRAEDERWFKAIAPVYDTYVKEKTAKGLPASEAYKFVQDWVKKNQK